MKYTPRGIVALQTTALLTLAAACATPTSTPAAASTTAPGSTTTPARGPRGKVEWQAWTPASFARAKAEGRILLVNVSTQWCHWCHVMDEETWADPAVAALVAAKFMPLRVDADARPDVGERYAEWGWPATAVLSPDAMPVLELKGFQEPRQFHALLLGLAQKHDEGKPLTRPASTAVAAAPGELDDALVLAQGRLDALYDVAQGGWGTPQKYPLAGPVEAALLRSALHGDVEPRARAVQTLVNHVALLDPVDGGMYQYSLRGVWTRPHFERLADIQGGALTSFAEAALVTGDRRFVDAALRVRGYVTTTLRAPDGAFYASQDADVGTRGELPHVVGHEYYALPAEARLIKGSPFVDPGVFASHNGIIITGLCRLYEVTGDDAVLQDATRAGDRVLATHRRRGGFAHLPGDGELLFLADQVRMGEALLSLAEVSGEDRFRLEARATAGAMLAELHDDDAGGFYAQSKDEAAVGVFAVRRKPLRLNAEAARFLLRLGRLDEDARLKDAAERALRVFADDAVLREEGRHIGEYVAALEEALVEPLHFSVVAATPEEGRALHRAALAVPALHRVVERVAPGKKYPDIGKPALYVCDESSCSPPITDPAAVARKLKAMLAVPAPRATSSAN